MRIRTAALTDLAALTAIERACFPPAEAATEAEFAARLSVYPNHFWLMEEDGTVTSFVNGLVSDEPVLRDAMYANASLHREDGSWQMIFGVNTLPQYRRQGRAAKLLQHAAGDARKHGRKGCVLTCKAPLVHFYESLGYQNEGVSASTHGGAVWYHMRLAF